MAPNPSSPPTPTDKTIGEFSLAGFAGFNPFPTAAARLKWAKDKLTAMGPQTGIFVIASDLGSGELVLLLGKDYRKQAADGANLEALGHVVVLRKSHADTLDRLNSSQG